MNLPRIIFSEWNNQNNPSGTRNMEAAVSGFIKQIDVSSSGALNFGFLNISQSSGVLSDTKLITFRPQVMGDATTLYNFRFYLSSISAWTTGTYNFLWDKRIHFASGLQLNLSHDNVPTVLPTSGNVLTTASGTFIQTAVESGVSQYIYLALFAGGNTAIGNKGGPAAGSFRYNLTFDFY